MFNRSEIMRDAWRIYRETHARNAPWQFARGIHDGSFSAALRTALRITKCAAACHSAQLASIDAEISDLEMHDRGQTAPMPISWRSALYLERAQRLSA